MPAGHAGPTLCCWSTPVHVLCAALHVSPRAAQTLGGDALGPALRIPRPSRCFRREHPSHRSSFKRRLPPKAWQTLSLLSAPPVKPCTSLPPRREHVSHFLCSGMPSSGSFPVHPSSPHFEFPLGTSPSLLRAGSPKPSLFPCLYLLVRSAAALFHPAGTARVDSSVPLSRWFEMLPRLFAGPGQ